MDTLMVILMALVLVPTGNAVLERANLEPVSIYIQRQEAEKQKALEEKRLEDKIQRFLNSKNSKMKASDFIDAGKVYKINPVLLVAIGQKESQSGKLCFKPYNCFGLMTKTKFRSYREAIFFTAKTVKGYGVGENVDKISRIYCPPTHDGWARSVKIIMRQINGM